MLKAQRFLNAQNKTMKNRSIFGAFIAIAVIFIPLCLQAQDIQKPRALVVFYSRDGHTKQVAQKLAQMFQADVEELQDLKKRTGPAGNIAAGKDALAGNLTKIAPLKNNPLLYDIILIGTPSWFSNPAPAIRTFIAQNQKISVKNIGLFGTAHATGVETCLKKLAGLIAADNIKDIPQLALRHRDLNDQELRRRMDLFYDEIMKNSH
jgi:flavodoxin